MCFLEHESYYELQGKGELYLPVGLYLVNVNVPRVNSPIGREASLPVQMID